MTMHRSLQFQPAISTEKFEHSRLDVCRNKKTVQKESLEAGYPADVHADILVDVQGQTTLERFIKGFGQKTLG